MPKPTITCKLCRQEGPAADAHVIPRAFYEDGKAGADHLVLLSNIPGERRKISKIGIYDRNLLCQACEERFQGLDDYGIEVFLRGKRTIFAPHHPDGGQTQIIREIDPEKLQGFFGFLLWRILASEMPGFLSIQAPQLQERLRVALLDGLVCRLAGVEAMIMLICHDIVAGIPDISNLMNGSAVALELFESPTAAVGLGNLLVHLNIGERPFHPSVGCLAFPASIDRAEGLLLVHDRGYSNQHIKVLHTMVKEQHERTRIEALRRRVLKAYGSSFGHGPLHPARKGSRRTG